ncbi:unnamed protein product [Urochloa humidicola]
MGQNGKQTADPAAHQVPAQSPNPLLLSGVLVLTLLPSSAVCGRFGEKKRLQAGLLGRRQRKRMRSSSRPLNPIQERSRECGLNFY